MAVQFEIVLHRFGHRRPRGFDRLGNVPLFFRWLALHALRRLLHKSPTRNPTRPRSISLRFAKAQITDTASYTFGSKRDGLMGHLPALDLVPTSNPAN